MNKQQLLEAIRQHDFKQDNDLVPIEKADLEKEMNKTIAIMGKYNKDFQELDFRFEATVHANEQITRKDNKGGKPVTKEDLEKFVHSFQKGRYGPISLSKSLVRHFELHKKGHENRLIVHHKNTDINFVITPQTRGGRNVITIITLMIKTNFIPSRSTKNRKRLEKQRILESLDEGFIIETFQNPNVRILRREFESFFRRFEQNVQIPQVKIVFEGVGNAYDNMMLETHDEESKITPTLFADSLRRFQNTLHKTLPQFLENFSEKYGKKNRLILSDRKTGINIVFTPGENDPKKRIGKIVVETVFVQKNPNIPNKVKHVLFETLECDDSVRHCRDGDIMVECTNRFVDSTLFPKQVKYVYEGKRRFVKGPHLLVKHFVKI